MKQIICLFSFLFLIGCNSNEKNPVIQKKLDIYFENSSNVNLDKENRLKYIDSAKILFKNQTLMILFILRIILKLPIAISYC